MRRLSYLLALTWFAAGCASTTTPTNRDATDTGSDLLDVSDMPSDTVEVPPDVPTEVTPDLPADVIPEAVDDGGSTGGVVGDACYSATQCGGVPGAGVTCLTSIMGYITFPGGYCSAVCTSDMDCGTGGACVNLNDLGRYCLKRCTSAGDCRTSESYTCDVVTGAPGTYCIPPFTSPEAGTG
ncbi:MAG: hypothetical protein JRG91_00975 [Deltaproteobacteria bacterium]|nr:hypothetical protein [Deltaproteobacteria bacterium]